VTRVKIQEQISQCIRDTRGLGSNASHLKERSNTRAVWGIIKILFERIRKFLDCWAKCIENI